MGDLVRSGSKYSDADRRAAALEYLIAGNMQVVARKTGVPRTTLVSWKQSDWWEGLVSELRHEKEAEIQAQLSKIIVKAHDETVDRLENGDEVHTAQGIKRIKMRGRDTATVAAIAYDKLRLSLNQPTSIRADSSNIQELAKKFAKISEDHARIQRSVVSVQKGEES